MKIYGDYHTHTYFSDGHGSIEENLAAARERGLDAVAISDHGFNNPARFSLTREKADKQREILDVEREKYPDLKVYHAIEADIISLDGDIDMRSDDYAGFDYVLAGFHRFARPVSGKDFRKLYLPAYFSAAIKPSRDVVARNTRAFCEMIRRFPVAILAHINDMVITDVREVAKCAADYGTYLEINMKHIKIMTRALDGILATDVGLIANTDAHIPGKVGDFSALASFVSACPEITGRIANAAPGEINFRKFR